LLFSNSILEEEKGKEEDDPNLITELREVSLTENRKKMDYEVCYRQKPPMENGGSVSHGFQTSSFQQSDARPALWSSGQVRTRHSNDR
jgi:hypothetical protein